MFSKKCPIEGSSYALGVAMAVRQCVDETRTPWNLHDPGIVRRVVAGEISYKHPYTILIMMRIYKEGSLMFGKPNSCKPRYYPDFPFISSKLDRGFIAVGRL